MSTNSPKVILSPEDIPGAVIAEPYTKYTTAILHWVIALQRCEGPTIVEEVAIS